MPDGPVYFAYARPQPTDWHVVLAAPVAVLDRPWTRSLATLAAGGGAGPLVAALLAAPAVPPSTRPARPPAGRPPRTPARRPRLAPVRGAHAPAPWAPAGASPASVPPASVTIVALDATGRRAALDAARAGDTRFRVMADAAPVLVWLAAPDARRTWFNSQWLDFVGHRLEEEIGAGWLAHVHPDDRARCAEAATQDFAAQPRSPLEYRLRRPDGIGPWGPDDGVPLYAPHGTFTRYAGPR